MTTIKLAGFKFSTSRNIKPDTFLIIALLLALVFSLHGFYWGWTECWNPDQMAFRNLFRRGALPFEPTNFQKPPFHTYVNFFLSTYPFGEILPRIFRKVLGINPDLTTARLLWSRFLTICLFLGSVALVFRITRRFFGLISARILALLFATSAGFIVEAHYLTADIPLVFWMLVAFAFAQNVALEGRLRDYLWTGFFVGIATATKYNGLAVGITIVVAHLLFSKPNNFRTWKATILSWKLVLGLTMVVVGFIAGNPFAVITFSKFISWFLYNYKVAPIYDGSAPTDTSYVEFFALFNEIIGLPVFVLSIVALIYACYLLFRTEGNEPAKKGVLLLLSVFLLYYYKFGDFPRLVVRFVLPALPFWLMISGPFWDRVWEFGKARKAITLSLLTGLILYNALSSFAVGGRFIEDPRMQSIDWVRNNIPANSIVESTAYTPNWNAMAGIQIEDVRMPFVTGRLKLFQEAFKDDPWMMGMVKLREGTSEAEQQRLQWYSVDQLRARSPEYIILGSTYYRRFSEPTFAALYPMMNQFFADVVQQPAPYKTVFDQASKTPPFWIYPRQIEWVDNRITVLQRQG